MIGGKEECNSLYGYAVHNAYKRQQWQVTPRSCWVLFYTADWVRFVIPAGAKEIYLHDNPKRSILNFLRKPCLSILKSFMPSRGPER